MNTNDIIYNTKLMIDDLKTVCANFGLGNASSEYKIITEVFLYKFINDKFLHEIRKVNDKLKNSTNLEFELSQLSEEEYEDLLDELPASTALLKRKHFISYLFNNKHTEKFYELFDSTLIEIANLNINIFSVKTSSDDKIRLFDELSQFVIESNKKSDFCRAIIDKLVGFSFEEAFKQKYDFFATVFEYLIKDYNKDFGKYAEYYTPCSIASIIARIMVPKETKNVTVYDPAAGSGTLVLALAHEIGEENCTIFTQDISQKSSEFLRLNLILNNLVHSLGNVIHGDTLLSPQHLNRQKNGLMKFDYIVSNPPFNTDFSDNRNTLAGDNYKERFWAGVPNIPKKDKSSMSIYLLFIQHIIYSMKENGGKAAIVLPTPFLTKEKGIDMKLRKYLIDNHLLKGVITMPNNIFATTGTNVSVLIIEKNDSNINDDVFFVEASILGSKSLDTERNQKTILSIDEQNLIVDTFVNKRVEGKFSVKASWDKIKKNGYRLSPSTYFQHEIKYEHIEPSKVSEKLMKTIDSIKLYYSNELEDVLNTIFNYWFVQFDFPYNNKPYKSSGGKMVYNDILDMNIPEGWEVKNILDGICDVIDCLHIKKPEEHFEDERFYLLQLDNLTPEGRIDITNKYYISKEDYDVWSSKIEICEGDFIITNAGRAGAIGMVPKGIKCAIGRNMTAIRAKGISPYYMRQFLFSPYMQKFVAANLDEGSFFKSFNVKSIKKIYVLVPDDEIMKKYLNMIGPLAEKFLNGISPLDEIKEIKKIITL
ncbi:N-6 DNA methylase [Clostridium sp.]|uniref:N-6 DNA methylase n=1 Tax=Clostridium sp. TaxID=1506 RepID=UPI00291515E9|nr:N-6 DNA methylase [Clostridium sp.]MDU6543067.1 N-6 DNA methylase [Clostridium sp.]